MKYKLRSKKNKMMYDYNYNESLTEEERKLIEDNVLMFDYKFSNVLSALSTGIIAFFIVLGFVLVCIFKVC